MRLYYPMLLALSLGWVASYAQAAATAPCGTWNGTGECETIDVDTTDKASLQRGAALYMNYCLGCHSTRYGRYERVADDLSIPHELMSENLILDGSQLGWQIVNGMNEEEAKQWFGTAPPDLSLVSRARSPEWLYTYLLGFYRDESRPYGYNNRVFPNVGMPHVLEELQGVQRQVCAQVYTYAENGGVRRDPLTREPITRESCKVLQVDEGSGAMSEQEYRQAAHDITNYLHYMAEPYQDDRKRIGVYVLLYLLAFIVVMWLLNREYQKDIAHKH